MIYEKMAFYHGKIQLKETKNCFITLPAKWTNGNFSTNPYGLIVVKLIFLDEVKSDKFIYVTWNGISNSTEDCVFLDRSFAMNLKIRNDELILVQVIKDINRLSPCKNCYLKPVTENDYQLVAINSEEIENEFLNQLRVITSAFLGEDQFNIIPLWLKSSPNIPMFLKIFNVEPSDKTGLILTRETKIIVSQFNDNTQLNNVKSQIKSSNSLKSVFGLFRSLIPNNEIVLPTPNLQDSSQFLEQSVDKFISVPVYRGKPLFLRVISSDKLCANKFFAFVSPIHFKNNFEMSKIKNEYCMAVLRKISEVDVKNSNNEPLNIDTANMNLEKKFCIIFVDKFIKMHDYLNETLLLMVADPECPPDSIIISRWLIVQRSLPYLSYVSISGADSDPLYDNEETKKIDQLKVPLLRSVALISLNLFPTSNDVVSKIKNEINVFKEIVQSNNSKFEHFIIWNGLIMNMANSESKFMILNIQTPFPDVELEISKLLTNCFIIDENTKISVHHIDGLNRQVANYLNRLTKADQIIQVLKNKESILNKPFAGRDSELKKCLQFISNSLGLDGCENESSLFTSLLITGPKGSGKTSLIERVVYECSKNYLVWSDTVQCSMIKGKRIESLQKLLTKLFNKAVQHQPSILILEDLHQIAYETNGDKTETDHDLSSKQATPESSYCEKISYIFCQFIDSLRKLKSLSTFSRVTILTTSEPYSKLNMLIQKSNVFDQVIDIDMLDSKRRIKIIKEIFDKKDYSFPNKEGIKTCFKFDMKRLSRSTKNLNVKDLNILIDMIIHTALVKALNAQNDITDVIQIDNEHLDIALDKFKMHRTKKADLRLNTKRLLNDVGGLSKVKEMISDLILLQIKHPYLYRNLPLKLANSILLYGMPGTGKTAIVEAIANESGLNFISVKGPELLSKYIGQSERSVRNIFKQAQEVAPCILFFDEFDSLAPRRGHDSTGVTDRVVNQMLTLLDGLEERKENIFIIAATSRPDLIDLALLRPGRFDQTVRCDLPDDQERKEILMVLGRRLPIDLQDDSMIASFNQLVKSTENFSGADLQALLYNAFLEASKQATAIQSSSFPPENYDDYDDDDGDQPSNTIYKNNNKKNLIQWKHIKHALDTTKPSINDQERNRFEKMDLATK